MSLLNTFDGTQLQREGELAIKQDKVRQARCDDLVARLTEWLPRDSQTFSREFNAAYKSLEDLHVTQDDIDDVLVSSRHISNREGYWCMGLFIGAMVQNAYHHGTNELIVHSELLNRPIEEVCSFVHGDKDELLYCSLTGDNVENCATGAHHAHVTTYGNIGSPELPRDLATYSVGTWAHNCHFVMHGYVAEIGPGSKNCAYYTADLSLISRIKEIDINRKIIEDASLFLIEEDGSYTQVHP